MIGIVTKALLGDDDSNCDNDELYKYNTTAEHCAYIQNHIEDCVGESLINYYDLFYCKFDENYLWSALFTVF